MTENEIRSKVVAKAKRYLGCKESDGSHEEIIDLYNSHKPLPRGYKVKYTDAWCATFVSAVGIGCNLTGIMFPECSCGKMIELYKKAGRWQEADNYKPKIGDLMMYDWGDSGKGDNTGAPDHVGIVVAVNGVEITVIEGNKNNAVQYRDMNVNGRYIRGYCLPEYSKISKRPEAAPAVDPAKEFSKDMAKTYKVVASALNMRRGAGLERPVVKVLDNGDKVTCYGYYTQKDGGTWLLVKDSKGAVGYCLKKYLV